MLAAFFAMQENSLARRLLGRPRVDTVDAEFYSSCMFRPSAAGAMCCCMRPLSCG
jgi:hypothetical protein